MMKRLMFFAAFVLALAAALSAGAAPQVARGLVFNDKNGNGVRDAGESGVSGVCVSNGVDVVRTDRQGRYELPVGDDTVLFVIKPRGWMTPVCADNLPRFYYIHKPAGSPELKFPGVAPTGPLPESVDFPLHRRRESSRFRAILFGDTQTTNKREVDYLARDIVAELVGLDAAFGMTLGDIVNNDLSMFDAIVPVVGRIGIPWYNVHGNHDTNQDVVGDRHSSETFTRVFGPRYYAFEYAKTVFFVLDNIEWGDKGYKGLLGEDQLAFVRNYLEHVPTDRLLVFTMHIPIVNTDDQAALYELLADRPHTFSASAHRHLQHHHFIGSDAGWRQSEPHHHLVCGTACGCWWGGALDEQRLPHSLMPDGTPNGYLFLNVDDNRYTVEYKVSRRPADYQIAVWCPDEVATGVLSETGVYANLFIGSERCVVEMRLADDAPWVAMTRVDEADPLAEATWAAEENIPKEMGRRMSQPRPSQHLWKAGLPGNLTPGGHVVQIRAVDLFGNTHTATRPFRVVP